MKQRTPFGRIAIGAALMIGCAQWIHGATGDWPQWRGPNRDNISTETGLLKQWPAEGPPLVWKASGLGSGYSSVSVADGKIFTMGDHGDIADVMALDMTGKMLWKTQIGRSGGKHPGTRCTPTVDGDRVYATRSIRRRRLSWKLLPERRSGIRTFAATNSTAPWGAGDIPNRRWSTATS